MNVASLENCKTLCELSGWADTEFTYYANAGQHSGTMMHRSQVFDKDENLPAYDLGYLIRKLPDATIIRYGSSKYLAVYGAGTLQQEDTPENALCQLAIELFKSGTLTRDSIREGQDG